MLDGEKQSLQVGRETGPAHFGACRTAVKVFRRPAGWAFGVHRPETVAATVEGVGVAVCGDPEPAHRIESAIVRVGEPAVLAGQWIEGGADRRDRWINALDQDFTTVFLGRMCVVCR